MRRNTLFFNYKKSRGNFNTSVLELNEPILNSYGVYMFITCNYKMVSFEPIIAHITVRRYL